jgi:hypothetical protein
MKFRYRHIKQVPLIFSFIILGLLSCGDEYLLDDVDCSECYVPKPEFGPVTVEITLNAENSRIPIKIFKGKYEEKFLNDFSSAVHVDTISQSSFEVDLKVNEYYSVAAEYIKDGKKTIVVDGDRLKLYKVSDSCDEVCWIFRGGEIDATIKK